MTSRLIAAAIVLLLSAPGVAAPLDDEQAKPPAPSHATRPPEPVPPTPPVPSAPPQPRHEGQPLNVRVDITLTEQQGSGSATKKTVTLVVADGENGSTRSSTQIVRNVVGEQTLPLNVDAQPRIVDGSHIRLRLTVNWRVMGQDPNQQGAPPVFTYLTQQVAPILESGKPLVVAQSADPVSDRQVTVEAKATVLR